jgi:hypothetical protein
LSLLLEKLLDLERRAAAGIKRADAFVDFVAKEMALLHV